MAEMFDAQLIRIRTRPEILYLSQNRSVLATRGDGFIDGEADCGFFVDATRLLSRYAYRLNGEPLTPNALSNVNPHSWMGYYVAAAPRADADAARGAGGD